jgi:hypothetical protein
MNGAASRHDMLTGRALQLILQLGHLPVWLFAVGTFCKATRRTGGGAGWAQSGRYCVQMRPRR